MPRYGMDYGRGRMYEGGTSRSDYGAEFRGGWGGGRVRPGGDMRYGSEHRGFDAQRGHSGRMARGSGFRGSGQGYDTYYRRDFMTNQGDFSPEFGGGEGYGYRGQAGRGRTGGEPRGAMGWGAGGGEGWGRGGYDRPMRGEDRYSYGPHYGERWESIHPEDLARRNFDRR